MNNRYKIDSVVSVILVGSVTSCWRNRSFVMSISCEQSAGFVADGQTLLSVQLISDIRNMYKVPITWIGLYFFATTILINL